MKRHGNTKHGLALMDRQYYAHRHPVYSAWVNMRQRCNNPNRPDYGRYGGRGISHIDRWADFSNFLQDMGEPPKGYTLERIDNSKDYSPENCKWATRKEQSRNRSITAKITYKGVTKPVGEWAEEIGMTPKNLYKRVFTRGWDIEKAFTQPLKK